MPAWLVRAFALVLALASLGWGVATFPVFWSSRSVEAISDQILQGHRFATAEISSEVAKAEMGPPAARASVRRGIAVLKLRLVEDALTQGDRLTLDRRFAELKQAIVDLFKINPADPYFWLIYYWCELTTEGFSSAQLKLLEFSYDLGPNEGWIGIKRNRIALPVMFQMSDAISKRVVDEFAGMVSAGLIVDATASLASAGAPARTRLLDGLAGVPIAERERLARYLNDTTTIEAVVPGIKLPEKRFY